MDDIAIHTNPLEHKMEEQHKKQHQKHIHHVLDKLEPNDLYLKPEKYHFKVDEITYLGVIVSKGKL